MIKFSVVVVGLSFLSHQYFLCNVPNIWLKKRNKLPFVSEKSRSVNRNVKE